MKKFFIFIFSLLVSLQLLAHGPTPQNVQESVTVTVSADKAWTYVKEFGNIHEWLPGAKSSSVEKKR
jgi:mxaD protein